MVSNMAKIKSLSCKWCRAEYVPTKSWQVFCPGTDCRMQYHMARRRLGLQLLGQDQANVTAFSSTIGTT